MPVVPAFEIGLWNAWIFMLVDLAPMPAVLSLQRDWVEESLRTLAETNRAMNSLAWWLWAAAIGYSVFLPLRVGTWWFAVGLPIALVGAVAYLVGIVPLLTTPLADRPATTGTYRYSRHPMYVSQQVMFIGVGIASASWLFLLLTAAYGALSFGNAGSEEESCLAKYGDVYRDYAKRTPRWLGLPTR